MISHFVLLFIIIHNSIKFFYIIKKYIPILIALAVIASGAGYYLLKDKIPANKELKEGDYKNDAAGFSFHYKTGPEGYMLIDQLAKTPSANPDVVLASHQSFHSYKPISEPVNLDQYTQLRIIQ